MLHKLSIILVYPIYGYITTSKPTYVDTYSIYSSTHLNRSVYRNRLND